jgi:hypothetical protein
MVLTAQRLWSISNTSLDEESRHPTYASAQAVNLEARDLSHMAAKCRSSAQRYLHAGKTMYVYQMVQYATK